MDYCTAFLLGLVGSLHCAGMCGPLALAIPGARGSRSGFLIGRLAYNLGRILTYCILGLVFGSLGHGLFLAGFQKSVSIGLGVVLLLGAVFSKRLQLSRPMTLFVAKLKAPIGALLRQGSFGSVALLGLLNGLLPCGLVYVAGTGAAATGHSLSGAMYMAAFGAGTVPMMLSIGLSRSLVPIRMRLKLTRLIPVSICILGGMLILRGLSLGIPYLSPDLARGASYCHP
jgi:sulfite exporter TauE/SafE